MAEAVSSDNRDDGQPEQGELRPPKEDSVGRRALCLGALIVRAEFGLVIRDIAVPGVVAAHDEMVKSLTSWLRSEGLTDYQSEAERLLFAKPIRLWSDQEYADATWRTEALGVLIWALSMVETVPPYDTTFSPPEVIKPLGLNSPAKQFLDQVSLRPLEEISRARDLAERWNWRSRTTRIQSEGVVPPHGLTFPEIIKMVAEDAHQKGEIAQIIEGDLPAFGKAYAELSEEEYSTATSIAQERHFALNWLCGYSDDWDRTPTAT